MLMINRMGNTVFCVCILFILLLTSSGLADARPVKVGVYDNSPITFRDKNGKFRGLSIEVLEFIAAKEDWNIEFVFGTFSEFLEMLKNGDIDLQPYIAYTEERALIYDFTNEPLITNWGVVYTWPDSGIKNIVALNGKRVAMLKGSVLQPPLRKLAKSFNIEFEIIDVKSNTAGFKLVSDQKADAVVVNRIFGLSNAMQFNLEKTDIIYYPAAVRYATRKGKNADLIAAIDKHLKILKSDKKSIYYQSYNSAFKLETPVRSMPKWIFWAAGLSFFVIILLIVLNRTLNHFVREKTRALNSEIAERKQAEEAHRKSEEHLRSITQNSPNYIITLDLDYNITFVNKSYTGKTIEEITKANLFDYISEESKEKTRDTLERVRQTGEQGSYEVTGKWKDDETAIFEGRIGPILKNGEVDAFIVNLSDITGRVKAEEEKLELEKQLQYSQKLESLGVLAGGIAHDFNNLLMGIMGNVGMAQMKLSPESPGHTHLSGIQVAAERAAELTNQMLAYSGKGKFDVKSINLTSVLEEMSHLLQVSMAKNVVLKYDLDKDLPAIEADPSQIHQILMNLLTNASDSFDGKSGNVVVSTKVRVCDKACLSQYQFGDELPEGKYVYLEVSDTGSGMDDEVINSIFDPFFSTKDGGRGLGLSAVIGIVKGHNGAIKVISQPGRGTTFKLLFPASEKTAEEIVEEKLLHSDYRGDGTILVVDDEEGVRDIASSILDEFGFEVLLARDGEEALELFKERAEEISLVLLDLSMPGMGGIETFRHLKQHWEDVKVILSSGYTEEDAVSSFTGQGLADFIQKPYKPEELISKIRKVLEKES